ncbi:MAG: thiamine pyrophosphate-binding protein [Trueperaceae bacterium]|nr:MAG: thiamine pyrophosphate-binding protein [Trueperaceae bacterium]
MERTGSEVVAEMLIQEEMPYVIGIAGHGNLPLVDAFRRYRDRIEVIMPRHEQAAVHMADGYFRVKGQPLAVFTSIGAGATNTVIGLATAYVDSIPLLLLIGDTHTYMRGTGVLQELERQTWADIPRLFEPVVKRAWQIDDAGQITRAVSQALNTMLTGRSGPAMLTLPMDVQAQTVDLEQLPNPQTRRPKQRPAGDLSAIEQAAELLIAAERPVIVAGGGVILSNAEQELLQLAEHLGVCVVTTMQGKSCFPEDHPLYAWHMGTNATTCGNHMTTTADVLLAIGMRFADKAACSYRPGQSFNIPPTRLIHVDIDPFEIGKNYPVEVGIVGDAKAVVAALHRSVSERTDAREWRGAPYTREIEEKVAKWCQSITPLREADEEPPTMGRVFAEVRKLLPEEAIILSSSGNTQAQVFQELAFKRPRTYLSAGGFSTMGWSYPAALGAKLASPDVPVVALVGDGDFLMTIQEIATAVQYDIPAIAVVVNNQGWQAIRDLQRIAFGDDTDYATMFEAAGAPVSPHIADAAKAFGAHAVRIDRAEDIAPAMERALDSAKPAVIEVMVDAAFGRSGGLAPGWWDVPVPRYFEKRYRIYQQALAEERF